MDPLVDPGPLGQAGEELPGEVDILGEEGQGLGEAEPTPVEDGDQGPVEHRSVPGKDLAHHPQSDEPIVRRPAPLPAADGQHGGWRRHRKLGAVG
jgi:hypothetical protein